MELGCGLKKKGPGDIFVLGDNWVRGIFGLGGHLNLGSLVGTQTLFELGGPLGTGRTVGTSH